MDHCESCGALKCEGELCIQCIHTAAEADAVEDCSVYGECERFAKWVTD